MNTRHTPLHVSGVLIKDKRELEGVYDALCAPLIDESPAGLCLGQDRQGVTYIIVWEDEDSEQNLDTRLDN